MLDTPSLGPTATLAVFGLSALEAMVATALGVVVIRQRSWKATIENLKSSNEAAVTEMAVHKEAATRLSGENRVLIRENAQLKSLTNLEPLMELLSNNNRMLQDWVAEGRVRFETANKRLDEIHTQQSVALTALLEEIRAQRILAERSYASIADTLKEQALTFAAHTLEDRQYQVRFVAMMDKVERRLSDTAVRIGLVKWTEPEEVGS